MVLHNSKWDRKAKARYYKKHGITPEWVLEKQAQAERDQNELESNSWRFQDRTSDDEREEQNIRAAEKVNGLVDSSEHSIGEAAVRPVGEIQQKELRYFPVVEEDEVENAEYKELARKPGKSMFEDKLKETHEAKYGHIQEHDDPEQFHKIQEDIERDKMAKEIRQKFQKPKSIKPGNQAEELDIDDFLEDIDEIEDTGHDPKKKNQTQWLDDLLD
jgi:hypothetical protein